MVHTVKAEIQVVVFDIAIRVLVAARCLLMYALAGDRVGLHAPRYRDGQATADHHCHRKYQGNHSVHQRSIDRGKAGVGAALGEPNGPARGVPTASQPQAQGTRSQALALAGTAGGQACARPASLRIAAAGRAAPRGAASCRGASGRWRRREGQGGRGSVVSVFSALEQPTAPPASQRRRASRSGLRRAPTSMAVLRCCNTFAVPFWETPPICSDSLGPRLPRLACGGEENLKNVQFTVRVLTRHKTKTRAWTSGRFVKFPTRPPLLLPRTIVLEHASNLIHPQQPCSPIDVPGPSFFVNSPVLGR